MIKPATALQIVKPPVKKAKGRPKWLPDLLEVERLAAMGLNKEQIATAMGKAASTLYARQSDLPDFLEAYKKGRAQGIARVANALYEKAMSGDTVAMIFWMKCNAGWRDRGDYKFDAIEPKNNSDVQAVLSTFARVLISHKIVVPDNTPGNKTGFIYNPSA